MATDNRPGRTRSRQTWMGAAVLLAVAMLSLSLVVGVQRVSALTITVCPSGCDHTTIQAAIDAASPGDTVTVAAGTYNENVVIDKDWHAHGLRDRSGGLRVDDQR